MGKGSEARRKNNAEKLKRDVAKQLEDVCLHCVFMDAHRDKWPGWNIKEDTAGSEAFQDLVHSAIKVAVNVFVYLDEAGQMKFMQEVMDRSKDLDEGRTIISKLMEKLKAREPVKH
jgi:hypothetical protein